MFTIIASHSRAINHEWEKFRLSKTQKITGLKATVKEAKILLKKFCSTAIKNNNKRAPFNGVDYTAESGGQSVVACNKKLLQEENFSNIILSNFQ